jgi:uncharacterized protein YqgV (UPF0045/DUF77 family)
MQRQTGITRTPEYHPEELPHLTFAHDVRAAIQAANPPRRGLSFRPQSPQLEAYISGAVGSVFSMFRSYTEQAVRGASRAQLQVVIDTVREHMEAIRDKYAPAEREAVVAALVDAHAEETTAEASAQNAVTAALLHRRDVPTLRRAIREQERELDHGKATLRSLRRELSETLAGGGR